MRWRRGLYLFYRLHQKNLKSHMTYQLDFAIVILSTVLVQSLGLTFLWVAFQQIPTIHGWSFWETAFIYGMIFFSEGVASLFFEGTWQISRLVNLGEFDRYLLRPVSPLLQVLSQDMGINGIGNIMMGGAIIGSALLQIETAWTIGRIGFAMLLCIAAIAIRVAINLASSSSVFWTHMPGAGVPMLVHNLSDFAKFPITVYSGVVKYLVVMVVPYAFISFFPATFLFDKQEWSYLRYLTPLVAVYCALLGRYIFYCGARRYESVGN